MGEAELIFTALAELSTRQIAESVDATGMDENAEAGVESPARLDWNWRVKPASGL